MTLKPPFKGGGLFPPPPVEGGHNKNLKRKLRTSKLASLVNPPCPGGGWNPPCPGGVCPGGGW